MASGGPMTHSPEVMGTPWDCRWDAREGMK
jgi:hypothetical protein